MHKRIVTVVIILAVVAGLGLIAHLASSPGGPGLLEQLRIMVHGS